MNELEENRALIKQRLEQAGEWMELAGYGPYSVETHVLESLGWVDAELLIPVQEGQDPEEIIVLLQSDAYEELPGGWKYSFGIAMDPQDAPELTPEQEKKYLKAGQHQMQTYYARSLAAASAAGTAMIGDTLAFGYSGMAHVWLRANWQQGKLRIPRTQRRFRQKGLKR